MKSLEQSISPGQQKINEYAERIRKGADPAKIMQGLGGNFRDGIEKRLLELENQDIKNNEIKEAPAEQKLEIGFESESQPEIFIEKVPDQEQVLREQQKQKRLAREQEQIEELRKQLGAVEIKNSNASLKLLENDINQNINYESLTSEDILKMLAIYCEPYMSAPPEAVADGTFAGISKLKIENGSVVLIRHASDENHLIKNGKNASAQEMMDSSLFSGGAYEAGAVHTSADIENWTDKYNRYPIYGEFRIPVKDFLELGKQGKVIIGNLSEAEIVLSGDIAQKYLTKIIEKESKIKDTLEAVNQIKDDDLEKLKNLSNKKEVSFSDIWRNDLNFRKFYEQRALWQVRNYNPEWLKRDGYDSRKISPDGYFMKLDGTEADEMPSQLLNESNLGGISYEKFKEHILEEYLGSSGKKGIV